MLIKMNYAAAQGGTNNGTAGLVPTVGMMGMNGAVRTDGSTHHADETGKGGVA